MQLVRARLDRDPRSARADAGLPLLRPTRAIVGQGGPLIEELSAMAARSSSKVAFISIDTEEGATLMHGFGGRGVVAISDVR